MGDVELEFIGRTLREIQAEQRSAKQRDEILPSVFNGSSLYFGELVIEHPFLHAGTVKKEFSPVENPTAYRQEFLKAVLLFMHVMPLVERRLVNLVPDPCNFDPHLHHQILHRLLPRPCRRLLPH